MAQQRDNDGAARYVDPGHSRSEYARFCLVECPRCGRSAEATGTFVSFERARFQTGSAALACTHCGFEARQANLLGEPGPANWFGLLRGFARDGRCPTCGAPMPDVISEESDTRPASVRVRCPLGQHDVDVELDWVRVLTDEPRDPAFGCRLWLQTPCKGETLWAYNEAHLLDLHAYVGARLRERVGMSMAARLPRWITAAKNRTAVLRGLDRLAKRLDGCA